MIKFKKQLLIVGACMTLFTACTDENSSPTGDDRDAFTGSWVCSEQSSANGTNTYSVSISKIGDEDSISINNFYGVTPTVTAIALVSGNSLTIPFQSLPGGYTATGTGIKSNSKINLTYYVNFSGVKDTVTAVYSK